jgi:hypothetical protein
MAQRSKKPQPASAPAEEIEANIAAIGAMDVYELRALWRKQEGTDPPAGLTKDLPAYRALESVDEFLNTPRPEPAKRMAAALCRSAAATRSRTRAPCAQVHRRYDFPRDCVCA